MKESIGSTFMYNIIAIFIVMVFAILAGTLSYFKAFKVNSRIINSIEKYEGYNSKSTTDIQNILGTLGYRANIKSCRQKSNSKSYSDTNFGYCVYFYCVDERGNNNPYKYKYGVVTYITIDFPIISSVLKIPVYSETSIMQTPDTSWNCKTELNNP